MEEQINLQKQGYDKNELRKQAARLYWQYPIKVSWRKHKEIHLGKKQVTLNYSLD